MCQPNKSGRAPGYVGCEIWNGVSWSDGTTSLTCPVAKKHFDHRSDYSAAARTYAKAKGWAIPKEASERLSLPKALKLDWTEAMWYEAIGSEPVRSRVINYHPFAPCAPQNFSDDPKDPNANKRPPSESKPPKEPIARGTKHYDFQVENQRRVPESVQEENKIDIRFRFEGACMGCELKPVVNVAEAFYALGKLGCMKIDGHATEVLLIGFGEPNDEMLRHLDLPHAAWADFNEDTGLLTLYKKENAGPATYEYVRRWNSFKEPLDTIEQS